MTVPHGPWCLIRCCSYYSLLKHVGYNHFQLISTSCIPSPLCGDCMLEKMVLSNGPSMSIKVPGKLTFFWRGWNALCIPRCYVGLTPRRGIHHELPRRGVSLYRVIRRRGIVITKVTRAATTAGNRRGKLRRLPAVLRQYYSAAWPTKSVASGTIQIVDRSP